LKVRAIIFDLDGTVVETPYDWAHIREELGTKGVSILTYLRALAEPERSLKWNILKKYEDAATHKAKLKKGIRPFFTFLARRKIKRALVTNNSRKNVRFLLKKFNLKFDWVISRERGLWKPSGAPFLEVLRRLKIKKEECWVVGDSQFDIKAAKEAGIENIFILGRNKEKFYSSGAIVVMTINTLQKKIERLLKP
jgi:HAD superfamily hydrolase (TIGR01549 family)